MNDMEKDDSVYIEHILDSISKVEIKFNIILNHVGYLC